MTGGWDERDVKVREQVHIIHLCCNCGFKQKHELFANYNFLNILLTNKTF